MQTPDKIITNMVQKADFWRLSGRFLAISKQEDVELFHFLRGNNMHIQAELPFRVVGDQYMLQFDTPEEAAAYEPKMNDLSDTFHESMAALCQQIIAKLSENKET